jgi:hypothetical protein
VAFLAHLRRFAAIALVSVSGLALSAQPGLEYEVKAGYVFNFIQFVEWPQGALGDPAAPFLVCVYVDDPFGPALARTVEGEEVDRHPIRIERVAADAPLDRCQILFVPQSQSSRAAAILRSAAGPVLTVGESPSFLSAGGIINLFIDGGRVRFEVNLAAAAAKRLNLSSKLLRLARNTSDIEGR